MKKTHTIIPNRNTRLLTISMSEDAKKEFDSFCDENTVNKSKLIAWLIQQHLNELKKGGVK
jgi:metal-responsive CopG/Arc/MetJ family transcriptional regulator